MTIDPSLLPSLAWFLVIAKHQSFTKAAIEMDVSRAALSQHLKSLEQRLGVRLINRTTRDMSLTEAGLELFSVLQPAMDSIQTVVHGFLNAQSEPTGVLKIDTSRTAARLLLNPVIEVFLQRHPKLQLELVINDGLSNIIASGVDAGIRLGASVDNGMVAIPITRPIQMAVVGSDDYFKRHGIPETPDDLVQHNCLAYRFSSSGSLDMWRFTSPADGRQELIFEPKGNAIFNDDESMLQAALQGVGVIKHLDVCVEQYIQSGQLKRVLASWCKPFPGFYLYVPTRAQMPAKTRALMDFLVAQRT